MSRLFKRPVKQSEILKLICDIGHSKLDVDPAVLYTLRLITFQFFRETTPVADFADRELSMIYSEQAGLGELDEEKMEAELHQQFDARDFQQGPPPLDPTQESTLSQFPLALSCRSSTQNDTTEYRKPTAVRCSSHKTKTARDSSEVASSA